MQPAAALDDLLDRADAALSAGHGDEAARLYDLALDRSRNSGDLVRSTRAGLGAASAYVFGTDPGKVPAQLYDLLVRTTDDVDRARLAAALARCWSYAGQPRRSIRFATEAVQRARCCAQQALLADCLDAALSAHWGPDDLAERARLSAELDEVAAHVLDPLTRLQAQLWGLQVAVESLNLPAMNRHLRAMESLGEESDRARFFAASRRCMMELMQGRTTKVAALITIAEESASRAGLADAWMVIESMKGYSAVQRGDVATIAALAGRCEDFGRTEGIVVILAEAAYLWSQAGDVSRTRNVLDNFSSDVLDELPYDVNQLLTLQCVLQAALRVGRTSMIESVAPMLGCYPERAVINAGAVMFHGVTDDPLSRAAAVLGDPATAERLRDRAIRSYQRVGATWWRDQLLAQHRAPAPSDGGRHDAWVLRPAAAGLWMIGPADNPSMMRALRGFRILQRLLRTPGDPVPALELITEGGPTVIQSDLGRTVDAEALSAYRQRLTEIDSELIEADNWSDLARSELLRADRDALLAEIRSATGLNGRRRPSGSTHERARVAATKAIGGAIDRISSVDGPLGEHLRRSIRTGGECSYQPVGVQPDWMLD
ncbi:hypothetical protein FOE78_20585 [Microlunatus elymi]|uniref:Uncharacterized protein n=1 Tax=Microlunatus elymi TaxID=2596828 RepID=A0A516Q3H8_9ACTN|nr:hypothetical protein [Microlunatus elymi]QDP97979.1 hypothetical protein FOE78_20585 [Microlunatus elymi]